MEYPIVIERDAEGYGAWAPDLPGCVGLADTLEGVIEDMRLAIEFHLQGMREDGDPIPTPSRLVLIEGGHEVAGFATIEAA